MDDKINKIIKRFDSITFGSYSCCSTGDIYICILNRCDYVLIYLLLLCVSFLSKMSLYPSSNEHQLREMKKIKINQTLKRVRLWILHFSFLVGARFFSVGFGPCCVTEFPFHRKWRNSSRSRRRRREKNTFWIR